ncbi:MAG: helix-turn-helix domain-containing protein [Rhodocyclaceae bacterium]|jgi:putative molybdopterin biosynthesis protein|nr:MAG: helix-turn-helix domain-containing protein [Rhodocyclaceae bacterium]
MASLPIADGPTYLTVKQVAEYLQLNEKKIYALVQEGRIPATRATGKWLFPKQLVDDWLVETAHGGALSDRLVIGGSDDPLLAYAIGLLAGELGAEAIIAYCPGGTRLGLAQLARRRAQAAAIHWGRAADAPRAHPRLIEGFAGHEEWTIVQVALRDQGVILRRGLAGEPIERITHTQRWLRRQSGAGSQLFLDSVLRDAGLSITPTGEATSERQAAAMIAMGAADCAPGIRAAAVEFGLDFLPLGQEAFDLVLPRPVYFRALFQRLIRAIGSPEARKLAALLGGYDLAPLGTLRLDTAR